MAFQTSYATSRTAAFAGLLHDAQDHDAITMINNEASASMLFGYAVCFEGSTDDQGALKPDATSDVIAGILIHRHNYDAEEQDNSGSSPGVVPGAMLDVLVRGRIWVYTEEAVVPGDRLFIRAVATGSEEEGALRASADSTDCIDSQGQGRWLTTAGAGELALLQVDFTNQP